MKKLIFETNFLKLEQITVILSYLLCFFFLIKKINIAFLEYI
jgi:hypothetical protein